MAYSAQTGALRRRESAVHAQSQYAQINEAGKRQAIEDAKKAGRTAVGLKAAETVHDLLQKGSHRKNKLVTDTDWFKDSKIGTGDNEISLFSKGGDGSDSLFDGFILPDTPGVSGDAYAVLGEKIMNNNPAGLTQYGNVHGADMDPTFFEKVGRDQASKIVEASKGNIGGAATKGGHAVQVPGAGDTGELPFQFTEEIITDAKTLLEGEAKIVEGLGTWGKLGKALGPATSLLSLGTGINSMLTGDTEEEKNLGAASAVGGAMALTGAGIGAGVIGGGAAAGALGTTAAANFWNPVGWGIGIGAGLYGIGKGAGIL
mgnify:CR=1 FL=1